jgi:hypothetical protein
MKNNEKNEIDGTGWNVGLRDCMFEWFSTTQIYTCVSTLIFRV